VETSDLGSKKTNHQRSDYTDSEEADVTQVEITDETAIPKAKLKKEVPIQNEEINMDKKPTPKPYIPPAGYNGLREGNPTKIIGPNF
jgi:hypothetical protein